MDPSKRYQVFVSSTFHDLQEERKEIMQALLELQCFPAGMELFPASDDDSWNLIRRVIDDSDYYVVVVAGRYGSMGKDRVSYTEMEYRYAVEQNIPILGFVHENPGSLPQNMCEQDPEIRKKLDAFRKWVQKKHIKKYKNAVDLGGKVSRALYNAINSNPRPGWVRGDKVIHKPANKLEGLKNAILEAENLNETSSTSLNIPKVEDLYAIGYSYKLSTKYDSNPPALRNGLIERGELKISWMQLFKLLGQLFEHPIRASELRKDVNKFLEQWGAPLCHDFFSVDNTHFSEITKQLMDFGYIKRSPKNLAQWILTDTGAQVLSRELGDI